MGRAPIGKDEANRLAALHEYGIEDVLFDSGLNELIDLASKIFNVPIVQISLLESERQLFAAGIGLAVKQTPIDVAFCSHVVQKDILVIADASKDPHFRSNPLVTGEPHIRFYAGIPLRTPSGYVIGALCIIDSKPRPVLSARDEHNLQDLALLVMERLEMRRLNLASQMGQGRFEHIAQTSSSTVICIDVAGVITFCNAAAQKMLGYAARELIGRDIDTLFPSSFVAYLKQRSAGITSSSRGDTQELNIRTQSGASHLVELFLSVWNDEGRVSFGAVMRDVAELRCNEERLFLLAHLDPLTGLANRSVLTSNLEQALKNETAVCIMLIDLDGFKDVNDSLGHVCGDDILVNVAKRIRANVRANVLAARMGGDEFALLFPGLANREVAANIAGQITHAISQKMVTGDHLINISASIGMALYPENGATVQALLTNADLALHQAKTEGCNCHRFFTHALRENLQARQAFQTEFARAYEKHEFEVFYQPLVRLSDNKIVGAEALLRWRHPQKGLLGPSAFLTALESGSWAASIGDWILRTACKQAAAWCQAGAKDFRISINLFSAQFRSGTLSQHIAHILQETGLQPGSLELEITENIILRYDESMLQPLHELREAGVGIAFDDYGTGYASLSVLKNYPVTRLKIDQTFVRTLCESETDAAIVWAVLYLGKSFGLGVIAEGVETQEACERLKKRGCDEGQGFLFGHPMPAKDFSKLLQLQHAGVR